MIQLPANAAIFVIHEAISFRNGIDGIIGIVKSVLQKDPMDGAFFVFRGKMGHSLRILYYDGSGYWLCTKRLSKGRYENVWPNGSRAFSEMLAREIYILIWGADPCKCDFPELWKKNAFD
jgi:transposase